MFQNDYRREMDGLRPSPAAVERLNRLLEEGAPARRSRRLGRRAAAALALCAALCVTAVAAGPTLWDALEARELIKVTVLETAPMNAREACQELCEHVHCEPVQVIGSKFVVYRKARKDSKIDLDALG